MIYRYTSSLHVSYTYVTLLLHRMCVCILRGIHRAVGFRFVQNRSGATCHLVTSETATCHFSWLLFQICHLAPSPPRDAVAVLLTNGIARMSPGKGEKEGPPRVVLVDVRRYDEVSFFGAIPGSRHVPGKENPKTRT